MKKTVLAAAIVTLSISSFMPVMAQDASSAAVVSAPAYSVVVNGKNLDVNTYVDGKCVMVPARAVGEAMGFTVTWNADKTVTIDSGEMHTTVTMGEDSYIGITSIKGVDGVTAPFSLGAGPKIINDRTYVPAELFRVLLGNSDSAVTVKDSTVTITSKDTSADTKVEPSIPNPLTEHKTIDELKSAVGFDFKTPATPDGYSVSLIQDIDKSLAEIRFSKGESEISYRISRDTTDNSGVYTEYQSIKTLNIDKTEVSTKGTGDSICVAVWFKDGFCHSVYCEKGITSDMLSAIVKSTL